MGIVLNADEWTPIKVGVQSGPRVRKNALTRAKTNYLGRDAGREGSAWAADAPVLAPALVQALLNQICGFRRSRGLRGLHFMFY